MILLFRPFFMGFCLWLAAWMSTTPALAARVSCEDWNTWLFFQRAGVADISRCLKVKNPNARDGYGRTPLHYAAKYSRTPAVVTALLKAGADPNARGKRFGFGGTPLHYAAWYNKTPAIVTALLKAGAEVNTRDKFGWTHLHTAAVFSKTPAVVSTLLDTGADPAVKDKKGKTP